MNTEKAIRFFAKTILYILFFMPILMLIALIVVVKTPEISMSHTTFLGFETTLFVKTVITYFQSVFVAGCCANALGFFKE